MNARAKFYAFIILALRFLFDLALSIALTYKMDSYVPGVAYMIGCLPFLLLLFFGFLSGVFYGRNGARIYAEESIAYWFVVGFIAVFHLVITVVMIRATFW